MTNKKKYFRTYIVEFSTSTGVKYYAGQRTSKYQDPVDDPYTGSGKFIKRAVNKYGRDCINYIQWYNHADKAEMDQAEIALIAECKAKYGSKCVNIAGGGEGGNTLEYMTDEQKAEHSVKCSAAQNRPDVKAKKKETWQDPEVKARQIAAAKEAQNRPEVRAKVSAGVKQAMRKSPVWHGELYATLWAAWLSTGRPKYVTFQNHCKRTGITELALHALVNHFTERYALEQPVQVPDVPDVPDNVVPITKNNLLWLEDYTDQAA